MSLVICFQSVRKVSIVTGENGIILQVGKTIGRCGYPYGCVETGMALWGDVGIPSSGGLWVGVNTPLGGARANTLR